METSNSKETESIKKGYGRIISSVIFVLSFFLIIFLVIPLFTFIDARNPDAFSLADIRNAYTASQAYFTEHPNGSVTIEVLESYGFRKSDGVTINLIGIYSDNLSMTATHQNGYIKFHIDKHGAIKKSSNRAVLGYIKINHPTLWHILRYWFSVR